MNIEMKEVSSSQIHSVGHCSDTNTLVIRFRNKGGAAKKTYYYFGVPPDLYAEFIGAESLGVFFARNIRDARDEEGNTKYPHTAVEDEPKQTEEPADA